jgi:hypothetical protein
VGPASGRSCSLGDEGKKCRVVKRSREFVPGKADHWVYNRDAMSPADIPSDEVASAMSVRQELGKEYEPEVIEAFAERLEKTIDARIESRLGQQQPLVVRGRQPDPTVWIALGSIALGSRSRAWR